MRAVLALLLLLSATAAAQPKKSAGEPKKADDKPAVPDELGKYFTELEQMKLIDVESGNARTLAHTPKHPYTEALFSAALPSHPDERREEIILAGEVPSPLNPPSGCRFHPRCPHVMPRCSTEVPALTPHEGRLVACHLFD